MKVEDDWDSQLWGGGSPFKKNNDKTLTDRSGTRCYLMGNTAEILREIKTSPRWKGAKVRSLFRISIDASVGQIAYCSCTDEPTWADECMRLFEIGDGMTLESVSEHVSGPKICCDVRYADRSSTSRKSSNPPSRRISGTFTRRRGSPTKT